MTGMSLPSRGSWRIETNPVGDCCLRYVTALLTVSYITGRGKNNSSLFHQNWYFHTKQKRKQLNYKLMSCVRTLLRISQTVLLFDTSILTSLCSASYVRWQRSTARRCCSPPAVQQSIDISCPPYAEQQTCSSGFAAVDPCRDRQTEVQRDVTRSLLCTLCGQCQ